MKPKQPTDQRHDLPTKEALQREAHDYLMRVTEAPKVLDLFGDDASVPSRCVARDEPGKDGG